MNLYEKIEAIKNLGMRLPTVNYEFKGYESIIIDNKDVGLGGATGIEIPEIHTTFELACDRIIDHWAK